jgi:2',3'-cyclic-nucleotide 2'-phosphodiesterase (5'-nucleotidase family)
MKKIRFFFLFFAVIQFLFVSCDPTYVPRSMSHRRHSISPSVKEDSALLRLIHPYGDSIRTKMEQVVGTLGMNLDKAMPSSSLGNFMADAYLNMARKNFTQPIAAALVNYGGIRLNQLSAGPVTCSEVFELMPFDNLLVLQELTGHQLQLLLDLTASRGGWPVAGLTMRIKHKKAVDILIGGEPLDPQKKYWIVNSDFVASGGDNAAMLKVLPQVSNGYLVRDAIFDYIQTFTREGKPILVSAEKRVMHAQ